MQRFLISSVLVISLFVVAHQGEAQDEGYTIKTVRPEGVGLGMFVRGDAEADYTPSGGFDIDLFDGLRIIYWIGGVAPAPPCENAADAEDDEDVDIFDGVLVIYWLGGVAPEPPPPNLTSGGCGTDPTPGPLTCESFPPCGGPKRTTFRVAADVGRADENWLAVSQAMIKDKTVVVPVTVTNAEPLVGFTFVVEYDPAVLTATAVDNVGLATERFAVFASGVTEPGLVKVAAVGDIEIGDGVEKLPAGEHQVARIIFELNEKALSQNVSLKVANSVMAAEYNRALNHRRVDGKIVAKSALSPESRRNRRGNYQ